MSEKKKEFNQQKIQWRVMLNFYLWNKDKFNEDFLKNKNITRIAQSKGRCRMVVCPQKGDNVSFVCKGKIIMKGIVDSNGFENGIDHQIDTYNLGKSRPHSITSEFAWIIITDIGLSEDIRRTGQRTWAKMPI
jgi:hypothetical protein